MRRRCCALACWALLAAGCGSPAPEASIDDTANVTTFLGGAADEAQFTRALAARAFVFPADHGAHPDFRTEWWYLTGNLAGDDGRAFGFQITFFRFALAATPAARESAWGANQLWMAHFAITDGEDGVFLSEEKFDRGALGLAGAQARPFRVWVSDWELGATGDGFFPLRLRADASGFSLDLEISGGKPLVLQGDAGLDPKGPEPGNASYYYSYTRLPGEGQLRIADTTHAVRGTVWMDREWSTSVLGPDVEGWNWFALQLDDGSDLMYYRLRRKDGGTSPYSGGILVDERGVVIERFDPSDTTLTPLAYWTSPRSGVCYAVAWQLDVPRAGIALEIRPRVEQQELDLSVRYWEGAVTVSGRRGGAAVSGVGYAEHAGVSRRDE